MTTPPTAEAAPEATPETRPETRAEIRLATSDLTADLGFFTGRLGMRLDMIYPADDPRIAVVSGHGTALRLERGTNAPPGAIRLLAQDPAALAARAGASDTAEAPRTLVSPGGTRIEITEADSPLVLPEVEHAFVVRRLADQAPWVIGRAGMQYRDLVPSRLGGAMIASHIRIAEEGPVPDMVHYHKVGFQLIYCVNGWVDVVYEDQGDPIRLTPGACFIQPPQIRHRVLRSGDNLEVLEIGVPAEHITIIDHEMTLPNGKGDPNRTWEGQRFVHNTPEGASWAPFRLPGYEARDTTIAEATGGTAGVQVVRPMPGADPAGAPTPWARHEAGIHFGFVTAGEVTLEGEGKAPYRLARGDAFATPPGMATRLSAPSADFEYVEVTLPGRFETRLG